MTSQRFCVCLFVSFVVIVVVVILNENPGVWNLGSLLLSDF